MRVSLTEVPQGIRSRDLPDCGAGGLSGLVALALLCGAVYDRASLIVAHKKRSPRKEGCLSGLAVDLVLPVAIVPVFPGCPLMLAAGEIVPNDMSFRCFSYAPHGRLGAS